ncbi:MAG: hypothetical protein DI535_07980 [Citrobacter freundii]|nr:MAG: hypothetical protein DI535_07980 [Citrobacter freundii]
MYGVGKTGTGKSTLLLTMAIADIQRGNGCCVIDPHGQISEILLNYIPKERIDDVVYLNAADDLYSVSFNPIANIPPKFHNLAASHVISALKNFWSESWGPRLEHVLRFSILSLLACPETSILDVRRILTDSSFRTRILSHVTDEAVLAFWKQEFDKYSAAFRAVIIAPILNKIGALNASIPFRNILGKPQPSISIDNLMNSRKIILCNLAKGIIGEDVSSLLGSLLIASIQSSALGRASIPEAERVPFFLFIDEAQSFVTLSLTSILSEARKYGLGLCMVHQYIDQLDKEIRSAIFGNVGTIISFRVGASDAPYLEREFRPVFDAQDLIRLPNFFFYIKLMIDGIASVPFSAETTIVANPQSSNPKAVIESSRGNYATPINEI